METYSAKLQDIKRKWLLIDANNLVLGRLAAEVAKILRGKHKAMFTPSIDCGDNVVIINAEKIKLTGRKRERKVYYRHTGFPGGIKETTPKKLFEDDKPEQIIKKAVQRMLSRDALGRKQLSKLKVYKGSENPHSAQNPEKYDFGSKNRKNKIG